MFIVFLLLGGWGIIISLREFAESFDSYRQNTGLERWARISESLIISIQHLSFERGRVAVVLRGSDPVSDANREFIADRRRNADEALKKCLASLPAIPETRMDVISERLRVFQELRPLADRNLSLPRRQRDGELVFRWYTAATDLIESLKYAADVLIGKYIPGDARRIATFASTALELRITAGAEATVVAQSASEGKMVSSETMGRIHRLRGIEDRLWYEIDLNTGYIKVNKLKKMAAEIRNVHMTELRAKQDLVLADLNGGRTPSVTVNELTSLSPQTLDGISNIALSAAHEASSAAEKGKRDAIVDLLENVASFAVLVLILMYSVRYVGRHIVHPLEHIDGELHRVGAFTTKEVPGNEIDRVRESTTALERTLKARAEAEAEREKTIQELRYAMDQVRTLSGFLPICANCKRIRDDKGYWGQVEEYISKHADVQFSHSLCPDCAHKLYGDLKPEKN